MGEVKRSLSQACLCQLSQKGRPVIKVLFDGIWHLQLFCLFFIENDAKCDCLQFEVSMVISRKPVANVSLCSLPL